MSETTDKKHLRQTIRHQRRELPKHKKLMAAKEIAQHVFSLSEFQHSQHIAYYLAHDGEADPHIIIAHAEKSHKQAYLPVLDLSNHHHLEFYSYHSGDTMLHNRFGISEPDTKTQQSIAAHELDCVFLPLVAFDESGNRLGRGAGYYDRTFAFMQERMQKRKPCLIALAYDFQKIPRIAADVWDIPVDIIVTEKHIYKIRNFRA